MKIACLSDLHGELPDVPDCDLLLLGGDYCPYVTKQYKWLKEEFSPWLKKLSTRMKIVGVAGNHDLIFEKTPELVPQMAWTYLHDKTFRWNNLNIYGSPWLPKFRNWAFGLIEAELEYRWSFIPDNTDILVLHGPPHGFGDYVPDKQEQAGSFSLTARIQQIKPKLVVCGHIHEGYGKYLMGETTILNCAYVNQHYEPQNPIQIFEI